MEKYTYTGKNLDELKTNAYQELNLEENNCLIKVTEDKGSLFKGQSYTLDVYKITDVAAEIKNYLTDYITNEEYELAVDSPELKDKINKAIETIDFSDEGYYISVGSGEIGDSENKIVHWYEALKKEYNSSSKDNIWVLMVTGYDPYDLKPSGKVLTYVLADILNLHESYFDDIIPNKGLLEISEWNDILDEVYKKNKLYLGLHRTV